tara:strand:+ start:11197 stop:11898 length:702 start_codon:yes stop_codon:yes gene_type:complete
MHLAVIPARSGSKGIPNKNIQHVGNLTLLERAIKRCTNSNFDKIVVSTDSLEYAEIARQYPVTLSTRPKRLSGDKITLALVMQYELSKLDSSSVSSISSVQPTSPFLSSDSLNKVLSLFDANNGSSCITTISRISEGHPFTSLDYVQETNDISPFLTPPEGAILYPRQARKAAYRYTGGIYCRSTEVVEGFSGHSYALGSQPKAVLVSSIEAFDINSPLDLSIANYLASNYSI